MFNYYMKCNIARFTKYKVTLTSSMLLCCKYVGRLVSCKINSMFHDTVMFWSYVSIPGTKINISY